MPLGTENIVGLLALPIANCFVIATVTLVYMTVNSFYHKFVAQKVSKVKFLLQITKHWPFITHMQTITPQMSTGTHGS